MPLAAATKPEARDRRRWISPEPLNVAPQLVGLPLAPPVRRLAAIALDLAVVALLTDVSGFWLLGGLTLVLLQLRSRRGGGSRGPRWVAGWAFAGVLGLLALQQLQAQWQDWRQDGRHPQARPAPGVTADEEADDPAEGEAERADAAAEIAAARARVAALPASAVIGPLVSAALDQAASAAAASAAASAPRLSDAQRIARLEAELAEARRPKPLRWRDRLGQMLDELGAGLGWGIVYFSLLPAWWGGQTVGKKLLGLRVVELTGKPMTVMRCLKRYGGYAAGAATGGLGFAQALWDPNRQAIQDKTAHTVVIDLRAPPRTATDPPEPSGGGPQSS